MRDLKAVQAREAILSGAIRIRVFDEAKAEASLGRFPGMMHANLFINDEFAVAGSANFSRRGMSNNIEFNDRVLSGQSKAGHRDPHEARREAGETFWAWGRDWRTEALEILSHLLRHVSPDQAMRRLTSGMQDFQPWRPISARMGSEEEDLVFAASQTIYEHGAALVEVPAGSSKGIVGRAIAAIVSDMYERCIMHDDGAPSRRHGTVSLVSPLALEAWKRGRRGPMRIMTPGSDFRDGSELMDELKASAGIVLDSIESDVSRILPGGTRRSLMTQAAGGWTVGLSHQLPGGLLLEGALDILETAGALHLPQAAIDEIGMAAAPLALTQSAKRPKRTQAKAEAAQGEVFNALGAVLCRSTAQDAHKIRIERREIELLPFQFDLLDQIDAELGAILDTHIVDVRAGDPAALAVRSGFHRIAAGLMTSVEALRIEWQVGLGGRLKRPAGDAGLATLSNQAMLPMFGEPIPVSEPRGVEAIEALIMDRSMSGFDTARIKTCLSIISHTKRCVILVDTAFEVSCIADELSEACDARVFGFGGCRMGDKSEGDVIGGGKTVGHRTCDIERFDELSDFVSDGASSGILVLPMSAAAYCEFRGIDAFIGFASPESLKVLAGVHAAIVRSTIGEADGIGILYCISAKPAPNAAERKLASKSFREAVLAGSEGSIGCDLVDIAEVMALLVQDQPTPAIASTSGRLRAIMSRLPALPGDGNAKSTPGGWGAEFALLRGAATPFTAFFLSGKTGRRGEDFMPPRIVLVRETAAGFEIVRNQVDALDTIASCYTQHAKGGHNVVSSPLEKDEATLETIGEHLAAISHWDIRPERVAVLCCSLAEFLVERRLTCEGASVLGDLSLPSLELLSERWGVHLGPSWVKAKKDAADRLEHRSLVDGLIGIGRIEDVMRSRPSWETDGIRSDMREFVDDLLFADREKSKTVQDRVAVILRGDRFE
ncbi:hypothetical protein ACOI1H_22045 [Loktanella sp. DJP18]|uniref:hypothetical protein n=1 Tax=Loktanella sp. DJP18 TaxID=3409788 RepID=UPI003BB71208